MLFVLLAVVAFYAVLLVVGGVTGVLAAIGWTTYAVRGRHRLLSKANLVVNIGLTIVTIIAVSLPVAWFAWFGGNVLVAGIHLAGGR